MSFREDKKSPKNRYVNVLYLLAKQCKQKFLQKQYIEERLNL